MDRDINNFKQNHPELVVADLAKYVAPDTVRDVLKYRGINKWLRVRRLLIQLKVRWREREKEIENRKHEARIEGDYKQYYKLLGYKEALIDCRQQVRSLCHSPRAVDFPQNKRDFGCVCNLPQDLPLRPHKRWFWRYDGMKPTGIKSRS